MAKTKSHMIEQLVKSVNEQLAWGEPQDWTNKDFEQLSEQIFEQTQKRLSITTLKRVWGRAERVSNPSITTLDILAEFGGYKNWRDFVRQNELMINSRETEGSHKRSRSSTVWIAAFCLIGLVSTLIFIWTDTTALAIENTAAINKNDFKFKSSIISDDIPNSVVFTYDVSHAKDKKIEIQQDWDQSKRISISKEDSIATCIYYRPGFFKSKLVIDSTIILEDDVFIKTRGWLGVVEQDPIPIYFAEKEIFQNGDFSISTQLLKQYDIDPMANDVFVSLYNVQDFGELYVDNFELNMELNNTHINSRRRCCSAKIVLLFDGSAIRIPLANKGCIANLSLMTFDDFIDGSKHDLSAFGVDFEDFQAINFISQNGILKVFLNGKSVYEMPVPESPLKIKGISVHFDGAGTIKNVSLRNTKGLVYRSPE